MRRKEVEEEMSKERQKERRGRRQHDVQVQACRRRASICSNGE